MNAAPVAGGRVSTALWAGPSRPFAGWRPDRMTPPVALSQRDMRQGSEPGPARVAEYLGRRPPPPSDGMPSLASLPPPLPEAKRRFEPEHEYEKSWKRMGRTISAAVPPLGKSQWTASPLSTVQNMNRPARGRPITQVEAF